MSLALFLEQLLNGLQLGIMLFLMAAGLTLIFGVMGLINLAHGSLYMVGAFACATVAAWTGSFWLGLLASLIAAAAAGAIVEMTVLRRLYDRDHLDQVLATFALILIFSEGTRWVFGSLPPLSEHSRSPLAAAPCRCRAVGVTSSIGWGPPIPPPHRGGPPPRGPRGCPRGPPSISHLQDPSRHAQSRRRKRSRDDPARLASIRYPHTVVFALGLALAGLPAQWSAPCNPCRSAWGETGPHPRLVVIVIGGHRLDQGCLRRRPSWSG